MNPDSPDRKCYQRCSAEEGSLVEAAPMFHRLFELSADAVLLLDPEQQRYLDCNQAAVTLLGYPSKEQLLEARPTDLRPEFQPDGQRSAEKFAASLDQAREAGSIRFEWSARRRDGSETLVEVLLTPLRTGERPVVASIFRDISARKRAEEEIRRLNASLEQRVAERTVALVQANQQLKTEIGERLKAEKLLRQSEERARTLVEHAPEAIVVLDADSGNLVECNEKACTLYGLSRRELIGRHPWELSPPKQPDDQESLPAARAWIAKALAGETPVFEWIHLHTSGRTVPCEIRLVRLPGGERRLIRGSIIDNTAQRRREQVQRATYQISEAVHTTQDLDQLCREIHQIVGGLMPAKNFYIALLDPKTQLIWFPYHVDETTPKPVPREIGTGLTGYVLRAGRTLLVGDSMNLRKRRIGDRVRFDGFPEIEYVESGAPAAIWLGVPLISGRKAFGVMAVQDYRNSEAYGRDEEQILAFIASQTALAVERKQVEQALRESEELHRALFEATSQGVMLHDEHRFIDVNPAAVRILGYDGPEQLIGLSPAESSAPIQAGGVPASVLASRHIEQCMREGSVRFDWVAQDPRGRPIPIEVLLTRIRMKGQDLIQAVINDISERKRREQIERALARISESVHMADELDDLYPLIHGAVNDLMSARNFYLLLPHPGTDLHAFAYHVDEVDQTPPPYRVEGGMNGYVLRTGRALLAHRKEMERRKPISSDPSSHPSNPEEWFLELGSPSAVWLGVPLTVRGQTIGVMAVQDYRDEHAYGEEEKRLLTFVAEQTALAIERKRAEAELRASEARLRESEARFSAAFMATPVFLTISRVSDGKFIEVNDATLRWSGYTRQEVIGKDSMQMNLWVNPEDRVRFWEDLKRDGVIRDRECAMQPRPGSVRTLAVSADLIRIRDEVHVLTVGLDVTQRKKAEQELLVTLAREKELGQLRTNFVSMVSHEFRTPLGIIQSSAEILEDYHDRLEVEERAQHLASIRKHTRRMATLMEEVLFISGFDAGKMEFKPEVLDLHQLAGRMVEEVLILAGERCRIDLECSGVPAEAYGDARLIRHIASNLLTNAVKYSPSGSRILFHLERDGREAVCTVRDQGIGIPEEDREWLFQAFHRGRNVGDRPGTGLGLVIVKRCVDLHGGKIRVESTLHQGTTFIVRLPLFAKPAGD